MKIGELIRGMGIQLLQGEDGQEIKGICWDSRKLLPGEFFVCIRGYETNGHSYIAEAVDRGAAAILVEEQELFREKLRDSLKRVPAEVAVFAASDTRRMLARLAAVFYGHPGKQLQLIGVTGTKGKTTTAYMIREGLRQAGHRVGLIGTVEIHTGQRVIQCVNTTPESGDIQKYLREMADAGCDTAVLEVSSQALKLFRTEGLFFRAAVFTNLGEDHIGPGEHADMEEYVQCKRRLFLQTEVAVGNQSDPYLAAIWQDVPCKKLRFEAGEGVAGQQAEYQGSCTECTDARGRLGLLCQVRGKVQGEWTVSMPGRYNLSNGLAAIAVLKELQVPEETIFAALEQVQVPGRMEQVAGVPDCRVLVDYAHNAMSLAGSLQALRRYKPDRLVVIFGCGGNRSSLRREAMGKAAGAYADWVILTSDNPRYEPPEEILAEIQKGLSETGTPYTIIADRAEAIAYGLRSRQPGDMILIAGKGHETYQEIKGIRYPMDDRELVRKCTQMLL